MSDSFVSVRNLEKRYGPVRVLKGVSLDIKRNQFVSLLGHSGCGKTTTLRIVLGFLKADSGSILANGMTLQPTEAVPTKRAQASINLRRFSMAELRR